MTWPSAMRFRYYFTFHIIVIIILAIYYKWFYYVHSTGTGTGSRTRKNNRDDSSPPRLDQLDLKNHRLAAVHFNLPTLSKLWWLWI